MQNEKLEQISKIAYSYKETVYHTYNTARELIEKGIDGCFVECGVGAGAQIMAMKCAKDELGDGRIIFGFDSFEGIPLAGPNDTEQPGIGKIKHDVAIPENERLISSGITVHSLPSVESNFHKFNMSLLDVWWVPGWFQNTLPKVKETIKEIALLRLDGDLYESTICCLQHLYPNVVSGGVVIIDDWGLEGTNKAVRDYFGDQMPFIEIVPGSGSVGYFIKN